MRINIIEPKYLTDQHLIAEYNEINLLAQSFSRSVIFKTNKNDLPEKYTLNSGHVKFFYNKGEYLYRRFYELKEEIRNRGFKPTQSFKNYWLYRQDLFNDWKPNKEDIEKIIERIEYKINLKPEFYRYKSKKIDKEEYLKFLKINLN